MVEFQKMESELWKLWGPRPVKFRFEKSGPYYFVGADVANYLRMFRGRLYDQFPNLERKKANAAETAAIHVRIIFF